jgi:hypothetical protein
MKRRTRRRRPSKYFIPKLYLCCAVVASVGPHLAQGGDASGSSSGKPHGGRPHDDDDEISDGSSTGQTRQDGHHRRWIPPKPHANENYGYDSLVIDPISMFGSPHGGFSRDVSSRLAALPLYLPSLSRERPPENPTYLKVRDDQGQLYACRVYHQDELDMASWDDGLFELPRLSEEVLESSSTDATPTTTSSSSGSTAASSAEASAATRDEEEIKAKTGTGITLRDRPDDELDYEKEKADEGGGDGLRTHVDNAKPDDPPQDPSRKMLELAEVGLDGRVTAAQAGDANPLKATTTGANVVKEEVDYKEAVDAEDDELEEADDDEDGEKAAPATFTKDDVEERLGALEGACAHIHLGWWSTEWSVLSVVR